MSIGVKNGIIDGWMSHTTLSNALSNRVCSLELVDGQESLIVKHKMFI
jgi:hypothetical protein